MHSKKLGLFFTIIVILILAGVPLSRITQKVSSDEVVKEIAPAMGSIRTFISSTGIVLPKNRLEIKPPVNGRIERILVKEGDKVKTGETLAWMSSTERAALLDASRGKGEKALQYWQDVYKPIPLTAPIDGEVIVQKTQPGQTITTSDSVVVLSDRLIIRSQVDETDIGKITLDKKAIISLDSYPDVKINAAVQHIYYESKTVNNVTIYEVDLIPEVVPPFFRSGMNATVDFIEENRENILLIPLGAVHREKGETYVLIKQGNGQAPLKADVSLGISDDKNIEIISGLTKDDFILLNVKKYSLPKNNMGSNPFFPFRKRR